MFCNISIFIILIMEFKSGQPSWHAKTLQRCVMEYIMVEKRLVFEKAELIEAETSAKYQLAFDTEQTQTHIKSKQIKT